MEGRKVLALLMLGGLGYALYRSSITEAGGEGVEEEKPVEEKVECVEGEMYCIGVARYLCRGGKLVLIDPKAEECGYVPPSRGENYYVSMVLVSCDRETATVYFEWNLPENTRVVFPNQTDDVKITVKRSTGEVEEYVYGERTGSAYIDIVWGDARWARMTLRAFVVTDNVASEIWPTGTLYRSSCVIGAAKNGMAYGRSHTWRVRA